MNDGDVVIAVIPQERQVLVLQVRLLYKLGSVWQAVDVSRVLVNGDRVWRPQFDLQESQLFYNEDEAIAYAKNLKLAPKKEGEKKWKR